MIGSNLTAEYKSSIICHFEELKTCVDGYLDAVTFDFSTFPDDVDQH